jgi:hypothetical protein
MELGSESLPAFRVGIVFNEILADDVVPVIEPITRMNFRCRENPFHANLLGVDTRCLNLGW